MTTTEILDRIAINVKSHRLLQVSPDLPFKEVPGNRLSKGPFRPDLVGVVDLFDDPLALDPVLEREIGAEGGCGRGEEERKGKDAEAL